MQQQPYSSNPRDGYQNQPIPNENYANYQPYQNYPYSLQRQPVQPTLNQPFIRYPQPYPQSYQQPYQPY